MTISIRQLAEEFGIKPNESSSSGIKTDIGRFSYFFCSKPNKEGKYSTCFIFPKANKDKFKNVAQAIINSAAAKHGKDMSKWPKTLKCPVRDGDEERDGDEFKESFFFNCGTNRVPGVVDKNLKPIMEESEAYSGCYGRLSVNFYYFDKEGSKGVGCGLNNVMITKKGERIDGYVTAENDFSDFSNDDNDDEIPF